MTQSQRGLLALLFFLVLLVLPLIVQLFRDRYLRTRGRLSPIRADVVAKYRYLAAMSGVLAVYLGLFVGPRLLFDRDSAWILLGFPLALGWLVFGPKPTKPRGRVPPPEAAPPEGQGLVLTRQEDPILIVGLPVYIDEQRVGAIRSGESQIFALTTGVHTLQLKPGRGTWGRTPPEVLDVERGIWAHFECGESPKNFGPQTFLHPERGIWLRTGTTPNPSAAS